jgi:hypothetical protein
MPTLGLPWASTGEPTSGPARSTASAVERSTASSQAGSSTAPAHSAAPAASAASRTTSSDSVRPPSWVRLPIAVYIAPTRSLRPASSSAANTRWAAAEARRKSAYCSGIFPAFTTDRLSDRQVTATPRCREASTSQREVSQVQGHAGSKKYSTVTSLMPCFLPARGRGTAALYG